jgi:hypothetical protein
MLSYTQKRREGISMNTYQVFYRFRGYRGTTFYYSQAQSVEELIEEGKRKNISGVAIPLDENGHFLTEMDILNYSS